MATLLDQLSGTWTIHILWVLHRKGTLRFGELRRQIGEISTKVLTERLRMMESMGIVDRHSEPTRPPKVTYRLTARGQALTQALVPLYKLVLHWDQSE